MRTHQEGFRLRICVIAVRSVLCTLAAVSVANAANAADSNDAFRRLTTPENWVELGMGYVTQDSFKFGEYNGLFRKGPYAIANFDVAGGGAYGSDDPTRYRFTGTDLGLDSRELTAEYGQQGRFKITAGYDELRHNITDTYQTPYLGAGTNNFTLPTGWVRPIVPQVSTTGVNFRSLSPATGLAPSIVNGVVTNPTPAQQATVNNIIANDVPAFHDQDLSTKRKRLDAGFTYEIDPNWEFKTSVRHEKREGLKPLGTVSSQVSEFSAVIPDLIDQTTDQYNVSLTYTGAKAFFQVAYYGSVFKNDVSSLTWQDVNDPTKSATMSSAPSNDFHQILLTGGYNFSPTTKLVLFGSYGRNTQNDQFIATAQNNQLPLGLPTSSLDGRVVDTAFNAKFTSKPTKGMNFVAAYKYDDRDNQTPVNTYFFQDANEARAAGASAFNAALGLPANTLGSNINIYANRPYSRKLNQANVDADYAIAKGHVIQGGYEYQQIERSCPGSWINCADAPKTRENTLKAEWRANLVENVSTRLAYAYSQRKVDYDENAFLALVPMANVTPAGGATISAYQYLQQTGLTGFGPVAGFPTTPLTGNAAIFSPNNNILPQALYGSRNNINEEVGMRRFNMADRNRNKVRATVNWDASDRLSLTGGFDYNNDDYDHSAYGLKKADSWALNLDGNYAFTNDFVATAYYTHEHIKSESAGISYGSNSNAANIGGVAGNTAVSGGCFSTVLDRNLNAKIDPCLNWGTDMKDEVDTAGIGMKYKGLMAGRLALGGDIVYTRARTDINVSGGSYANNPFAVAGQPAVNPAVFFIPATAFPTVTTTTIEFRLNGEYAIDRASSVRMLYWYQHLRDSDYIYDGMQFGTLSAVMPTNQQPYRYNVSVIGLSYLYRWQ